MDMGNLLPACISRSLVVISVLTIFPLWSFGTPAQSREVVAESSEGKRQPSGVKVTWQDVMRLVYKHPSIAAGHHRVSAARAYVDVAGAVPNPSLEGTTTYGQARDGTVSRAEWGLSLTVPLGWIAQRGSKLKAAEAEIKVAEAETEELLRDVILQLGSLFWNLVYAQEQVAALGELDRQTTNFFRVVMRRVDKGEVRPVEATRVELEVERLKGDLDLARSDLEACRRKLAVWLGVRQGQDLVAFADLTSLPQPSTSEYAREIARNNHPLVLTAKARVQALSARLASEKLARVPSVSIQAFTDHELDRRAYGVGLAIDLPVWNLNTGSIKQSENALAAGKQQLEASVLEIDMAAIEAQAACQAGVKLAARYKDRILPRAQTAAATIERTYQLGEATLLEVIDARRILLETRIQYLSTLVQAQTGCSRLRVVIGEDLS